MTVPTPNCAWRTRIPVRTDADRLILVFVLVGRHLFTRPATAAPTPAASVRIGPELVVLMRERPLISA